jgi:hypothetical protein
MPGKETLRRARRARREGKAQSTQAGEFVREEIRHIREGKHGARSPKQAIAIGLSKARRAGVNLRPPPPSDRSVILDSRRRRVRSRGLQQRWNSASRVFCRPGDLTGRSSIPGNASP